MWRGCGPTRYRPFEPGTRVLSDIFRQPGVVPWPAGLPSYRGAGYWQAKAGGRSASRFRGGDAGTLGWAKRNRSPTCPSRRFPPGPGRQFCRDEEISGRQNRAARRNTQRRWPSLFITARLTIIGAKASLTVPSPIRTFTNDGTLPTPVFSSGDVDGFSQRHERVCCTHRPRRHRVRRGFGHKTVPELARQFAGRAPNSFRRSVAGSGGWSPAIRSR